MEPWLKTVLTATLPAAAAVLLAVALLLRCRRRLRAPHNLRQLSDPAPGTPARPGLAKLSLPHNSGGSRGSLRFHHLHRHDRNMRRHGAAVVQHGPFQWADHPRLVAEAAENGWAQFVFAFAPRAASASPSPLSGVCAVCDTGTSRDVAESSWEVAPGYSEKMQAVRLNPAASAVAGSKKRLPGSIASPLRGDHDKGSNSLCVARMSLPLPGPPLPGAPFPQEVYFEITIIYMNARRPEWLAARASKRGKDGSRDSDRIKLIGSVADITVDEHGTAQETRTGEGDHQDKHRHLVISLGLMAASAAPARPSLPGTYTSSIGFHSDGAIYLDGMKLAAESEKSAWAAVDKVVGCGFEPGKQKVFFTVDGQLAHAVSCNSDAYLSPLYAVLASNLDVMALVNLGQGKFRYAPANARRTANPCFLRAGSGGDARSSSVGADFDDSGDLFSMGRVDSGWLDASRTSKSKKEHGIAPPELEADSELFEISLRD